MDSQTEELTHHNSDELDTTMKEEELIFFKPRRLVPCLELRAGMARFQFLLENCAPGSAPDPLLLASVLDLPQTSVLARACFLFHCAYLVHECNRGNWPTWLKAQASPGQRAETRGAGPRPSLVPPPSGKGGKVQLVAGKLFHQWGEVRWP